MVCEGCVGNFKVNMLKEREIINFATDEILKKGSWQSERD